MFSNKFTYRPQSVGREDLVGLLKIKGLLAIIDQFYSLPPTGAQWAIVQLIADRHHFRLDHRGTGSLANIPLVASPPSL